MSRMLFPQGNASPRCTCLVWTGTLERLLNRPGWVGQLALWTLIALWAGGGMLLLTVPALWARLVAGAALFIGGFLEIFLAHSIAAWRGGTAWRGGGGGWASNMIQSGPGAYRFSGSAVAGAGVGILDCALGADVAVGVVVGVCAGLAIWAWTWFAFTEID